jgi:hypothetical protein
MQVSSVQDIDVFFDGEKTLRILQLSKVIGVIHPCFSY